MFSLALRMGRTVRELLDSLDAAEFQEWLAYYGLDPWTEDRGDLRAGIIASTVVQALGGKAKAADFIPTYGPPPERAPMTDDQMWDQAVKLAAMFRGKIVKGT